MQSKTKHVLPALLAALLVSFTAADAFAVTEAEMVEMLKVIDDRQKNSGDYKSLVYIEQKERDKDDRLYEMVVYRRDEDDRFMLLFLKPKAEAGKGYLRIDKNLFLYDPSVGKWERRTERERIGGTDSRSRDFGESELVKDYTPRYVGEEKLGKFTVYHLELTAKKGADVAYPVTHMWIDKASGNPLKIQDYALSGRLMRTVYMPKWARVMSESKGEMVYYAQEIRIFDEVEKGNSTTMVVRNVDLRKLPANIFTKAWLESKSR